MDAYDVYQKGKVIDTVFFDGCMSAREVEKSLIEHDGYPCNIRIKKVRKKELTKK